jgi:hypothetical protein
MSSQDYYMFEHYKYFIVGDYKISNICKETFPCQHHIVNMNTGTNSIMNGREINELLKKDNLSHEHFNRY